MKYFNKKVIYQGLKFDSIKERDRYIVLKDMEKKGEISGLELQKVFVTLPKLIRLEEVKLKTKTKMVERVDEPATHYHADFFYFDNKTNMFVIEEIKSKGTRYVRDYQLRRKLVKMFVMKLNAEANCEKYCFKEVIA